MGSWVITPRDADLGRTADPLSRWTQLTLAERYGETDTWVLEGPSSQLGVFTEGTGCLLDRDGEQIGSGQVAEVDYSASYDKSTGVLEDTMTVVFESDTEELYSRRVYQDPTDELYATLETLSPGWDVQSGTVEDHILHYIAANLGPAAGIPGRQTALVLPPSLGRGGSKKTSARMNNLGELVSALAEIGKLRVRIVHSEESGSPELRVQIDDVPDLSANVRFGLPDSAAPGLVTGWGYSMKRPGATDIIVAGAGEKTARLYARFTDTSARALCGLRREWFKDQRQTDDQGEIAEAAAEELERESSPVTAWFTVEDTNELQYRRDYGVGNIVGLELPGLPGSISDHVVREAVTTVTPEGEDVQITIGTPGASSLSSKKDARREADRRRIDHLERSK